MQATKEAIIKDVRIAIDENAKTTPFTDESGLITDSTTLEMDDIIGSKIADGINAVRLYAPLSKLRPNSTADVALEWIDETKFIGQIPLPEDYLRFVSFRMSDWLYAVSSYITPDSSFYAMQFSKYKGVRGSASRPVVALSTDAQGGRKVIQFFSSESTSAKATFVYIPREDDTDGPFEIENEIYRAVVLKIASIVALTYLNGDMAKALNEMSVEQLRINI